jgi:hypothetical protein
MSYARDNRVGGSLPSWAWEIAMANNDDFVKRSNICVTRILSVETQCIASLRPSMHCVYRPFDALRLYALRYCASRDLEFFTKPV